MSFEFRSSYCVANTLCTYLKMSTVVKPYNIFCKRSSFSFSTRCTNSKIDKRYSSTHVEVESEIETSKKRTRQPTKDVLKYMHSKESLKSVLSYLPNKILKRDKGFHEGKYVVDKEVAKDIVAEIINDVKERNVPTFEINPGIGILSKELLSAGVNNLHLCESSTSDTFFQQIEKILIDFPSQVKYVQQNLLALYKLTYQDKQDGGTRIQQLLADVSKRNWTDDPVMIIIGTLPSLALIRHLIHCHIYQTGILSYGRPELYVIMSPIHYFALTCGKGASYTFYRSLSVLFQLIFQFSVLRKLPRNAFLPWEGNYSHKKHPQLSKLRALDQDYLYLVKIVPHQDFFQRVVKPEELHQFWFFIWYHMVSRKNRVITQLEKWIPGCGPRLIANDITIYTEFGELSPHQILSLFHEFSTWPEYRESSFFTSMDSTLMVMEQSGGELMKIIVKDDDVEGETAVELQETER